MKKVLIISYFYPPCTLTASQRAYSWVQEFPKHGLYPILLTRIWEKDIKNTKDLHKSTGVTKTVFEDEMSTVIALPYKQNLRDSLFLVEPSNVFYNLFRKVLTSLELLLQNFTIQVIPYKNIFSEANRILSEQTDVRLVVISANPFNQFFFGYLLKKKHPHIEWIADYRDDWTTTELHENQSLFHRFILWFEKRSEKKWLSNAHSFITVSPYYKQKIGQLIKKKGIVIYNGWVNHSINDARSIESNKSLTITFNGTLYISQPIELFLDAVKEIANSYSGLIKINLHFPGLAYIPAQKERVMNYMKGYEDILFITDRIQKESVMKIQLSSDFLLMVSHTNIKGVPSSKLLEYVGLRKRILVCPGDGDVIDQIVTETGLGNICNSKEDVVMLLSDYIQSKLNGIQEDIIEKNKEKINFYSRSEQTRVLASYLNEIDL